MIARHSPRSVYVESVSPVLPLRSPVRASPIAYSTSIEGTTLSGTWNRVTLLIDLKPDRGTTSEKQAGARRGDQFREAAAVTSTGFER